MNRLDRWIAPIALCLALAATYAAAAPPVLEYRFNTGAGTQAFSTGRSATAAWLLAPRTKGGSPLALWSEPAAGPSGQPDDVALVNRFADEGMGAGVGGWVIGEPLEAFNDLRSFTLTGWMRHDAQRWGSHGVILLAAHGKAGFGLDLIKQNRLRLLVNGEFVTTASSDYASAAHGWTFFAVTYDAHQPSDNVRFYVGGVDQPVHLVDTQTLAVGPTAAHQRPFVLGASLGGSRPFAGGLDNLRVFGSKADASEALDLDRLEQLRQTDLTNPPADVQLPEVVPSPVKASLVDVRKIWSKAPHNGFPDLARFNGRWVCSFREAPEHKTTAGGAVRIITSEDGEQWESAALFAYEGEDVRELHFATTPQGQLVAVGATADLTTDNAPTHRSYAWLSDDGVTWSERHLIPSEQDTWLWRATRHEGEGAIYGGAYYCDPPRGLDLYRSTDGVDWQLHAEKIMTQDFPSESDITFLEDGRALMLLRQGRGGVMGVAEPPYRDWTWTDLQRRIAAPDLLELPNGELVASVRLWEGGTRTALCWVDVERARMVEILTLPSQPDTGYAGLVWHDDHLWAAYYSDPGGETSIYFAKIRIE